MIDQILKRIKDLEITDINFYDDAIHFTFGNGFKCKLFDGGQSCCELRYMKCDDDLSYFKGSKFLSVELKEVTEVQDEYTYNQIAFVEIVTSNGSFTLNCHNEHNGYYGGFSIQIEEDK